jgi:hypothetical protein
MPALQTRIYGEKLEGAQNHKLFLTLGVALLMKPQVISHLIGIGYCLSCSG